jgi:predicted ribosome quality control (RQC) complex YloA/Tae2 family protein
MKVHGDLNPGTYTLEPMPDKPGYMLLRLFENVQEFTETMMDLTISGYEYDEYHLELLDTPGLEETILEHYDEYMMEAKLKEAEKETIPNLESRVKKLTEENTALQNQLTDAQIALCDIYEMALGGDANG